MSKEKKILQIKNGEYLLEIRGNAVATTYNKDMAMDISNWSIDQVGHIVGNLHKVGYTKAQIVTLEDNEGVDIVTKEELSKDSNEE